MLKRDISATNVLIAAAGGMIGSGWLFSPFISAQMAGSGALISWIIAALFMLLIALPLCELGAMIPISGGMANYPTFTHGKEVGFLFAWVSWLSYVVMTPIEIQAILQYGSHFFPALVTHDGIVKLSAYGYVVAILIMFAVVLLNTFGIKMLAECNKYASIFKFAGAYRSPFLACYTPRPLLIISILQLTKRQRLGGDIFSAVFGRSGFSHSLAFKMD